LYDATVHCSIVQYLLLEINDYDHDHNMTTN